MNKLIKTLLTGISASLFAASANATIINVSGPLSSLSGSAEIITAPGDVGDDAATNIAQQGFDEVQNYLLTSDLNIGGDIISSGTTIDSHMIFLNTSGNAFAQQLGVDWTFSGTILGIMSDQNGLLEASTNSFLGAAGTNYPGNFAFRGLEGNLSNCNTQDCYSFINNTLTLTMRVSEPGDWIRVITQSTAEVPEPSTILIFSLGIIGLGFATRKNNRHAKVATLKA